MEREFVAQINSLSNEELRAILAVFNSLPNEKLRAVLVLFDVNELINIRSECTRVLYRWVNIIDGIIREKSITLIIGANDGKSISELNQDYNGLADFNKDCVSYKFEASDGKISLSKEFTDSLIEQFNNVENLLFISPLDCSSETAQNLISLLNQWSATIVTLNLSTIYEQDHYLITTPLHDQINNLTSLRRIYFPDIDRLEPATLARLEHCFFLNNYKIRKLLHHFGLNCTSLYSHEMVSLDDLTELKKCNGQLVNGLTHLGLMTLDNKLFPFICDSFGALQMLNIELNIGKIFTVDMITGLAKLHNLSELSIRGLKFDLSTLARIDLCGCGGDRGVFDARCSPDTCLQHLKILISVQSLTISIDNINGIGENVPEFFGDQFCRFLAYIFPHLEQLTFIYRDPDVRNDISQHLNSLVNLSKHEIVSPDFIM